MATDTDKPQKTCFVVGPVGKPESDIRDKADWLLKAIIEPAVSEMSYSVERSDQMAEPGLITDQVIIAVMEADLVVADLTGHNPNAFYELAIRHMQEKPVVHLIDADEAIPFDVSTFRAVQYSLRNPKLANEAKEELVRQVRATEKEGFKASNPITQAHGIAKLARSGDDRDQLMLRVINVVEQFGARLSHVEDSHPRIGNIQRLAGLMVDPITGAASDPPIPVSRGGLFGGHFPSGAEVVMEEELTEDRDAIARAVKAGAGVGRSQSKKKDRKTGSQSDD